MSFSRAGSTANKAMSHAWLWHAAAMSPGVAKGTNSSFTPKSWAMALDRSGATPVGASCGLGMCTNKKLATFRPTFMTPLGANSERA